MSSVFKILMSTLTVLVGGTTFAATPPAKPAAFAVCAACHSVEANAPPGIGPNLRGLAQRNAGSLPEYKYSAVLAAKRRKWNRASLVEFLHKPQAAAPGTKMPFAGIGEPAASQIADYLLALEPGPTSLRARVSR